MDMIELLDECGECFRKALLAWRNQNLNNCLSHLGELYDLLDDVVGSGARDKCESNESSKGKNDE